MTLQICDDLPALSLQAAELVRAAASDAIAARGTWSVALAGGSTPKALYHLLAAPEDRIDEIDWSRTQIFFGDERSVPPEHPDSNYGMARAALLSVAAVPEGNVHRLRGEATDLDAAAREYEARLIRHAGHDGGNDAVLDLAILGMGADAHTASLFPATSVLDEQQRLCAVVAVPRLKTNRLTLTYPVFLRARHVLFLIAGADKAQPLAAVIEGPDLPRGLPCQRIVRRPGPVSILADRAAARDLSTTE